MNIALIACTVEFLDTTAMVCGLWTLAFHAVPRPHPFLSFCLSFFLFLILSVFLSFSLSVFVSLCLCIFVFIYLCSSYCIKDRPWMASLNAFRAQSFPLLGKKRARIRMRFKYFAGMTNMHSSAMQGFLVSQGAKSKNEKNVAIYVFFG